MNRILLALLVVPLLAAVAPAGDDPPSPALHFRLEIGVDEILSVHVRLEGESFQTARLDLDGDGEYEETRKIERKPNPRTGKPLPNTPLAFLHEGAEWQVDYSALGADRPTTYVRWSVKRGDEFYVWFINGKVPVHRTAEAAREGKAIRLGPPFRFELGAAVRGPDALVNVGCKDANGATLRLARVDGKTRSPTLRLIRGETTEHEGSAKYG
jgi:hypothetical protein